MTDDTAAQPRSPVLTAGAHCCGPVDELGLSHRFHLDGAFGAVHRAALDENGLCDVVAAAGISEQLVHQETVPGAVPKMMVRIGDLQLRFDDLLLPQREPGRVGVTRAGRRIACRTRCSWAPCSGRAPRRMTAPPRPTARPSRSAMSGATQ